MSMLYCKHLLSDDKRYPCEQLETELAAANQQIAILEKQQGNSLITNIQLANELATAKAEIERLKAENELLKFDMNTLRSMKNCY